VIQPATCRDAQLPRMHHLRTVTEIRKYRPNCRLSNPAVIAAWACSSFAECIGTGHNMNPVVSRSKRGIMVVALAVGALLGTRHTHNARQRPRASLRLQTSARWVAHFLLRLAPSDGTVVVGGNTIPGNSTVHVFRWTGG
jgi:hypothetical protein